MSGRRKVKSPMIIPWARWNECWDKANDIWETDQKRWWADHYPDKPYDNQMILRRCPIREQNDYIRKAGAALGWTRDEVSSVLMKP